jgi:hypothetical protein
MGNRSVLAGITPDGTYDGPRSTRARLASMADQQVLEYRVDARPFPPSKIHVLVKRQVPRPPNGSNLAKHGHRRAPQLIEFHTHFSWHGPAFYFSARRGQRYLRTKALMKCGKRRLLL